MIQLMPIDFNKEFDLLSEYLKYRIEQYTKIQLYKKAANEVFEEFKRIGIIYIRTSSDKYPFDFILSFDEWKYYYKYNNQGLLLFKK